MFLTFILSLAVATADGFPQMLIQRPHYPAGALSNKDFQFYESNSPVPYYGSNVQDLNRGRFAEYLIAPPAYSDYAESGKVTAEPVINPYSASAKSKFCDRYGTTLNTRSGHLRNYRMLAMNVPTNLQMNNQIVDDTTSNLVAGHQNLVVSLEAPLAVPKSSFSSKEDAQQNCLMWLSNKNGISGSDYTNSDYLHFGLRDSINGDQCPTGKVKVFGKCVNKD